MLQSFSMGEASRFDVRSDGISLEGVRADIFRVQPRMILYLYSIQSHLHTSNMNVIKTNTHNIHQACSKSCVRKS